MNLRYFATLFDSNYLHKGLALHDSLKKHASAFRLFVLCLDEITFQFFEGNQYPEIHPIRLADLEGNDNALLEAKNNRSKVEYYFTLSPVLPLYILTNFPEVDAINTLDADIFFYSSPEPIYEEFKEYSILITPHRFPSKLKDKERYGLYNVSFQIFRNDHNGMECLRWWKQKCIEWCYDRLEEGRFADQKYLDDWTTRFKGVKVMAHEGAGLAPWNVDNYKITKKAEQVYSNASPLIFFHFHYLKVVNGSWFTHGVDLYFNSMTSGLKNLVYHPYINKLIELTGQLKISADHYIRGNSAPKLVSRKAILSSYSTLYNVGLLYTIRIDLRRFFGIYRRLRRT